jgi:nicotinate-nucleotide adenylyltransferase
VDTPLVEVTSTDVRARVRARKSIRYLVPDPVAAIIAAEGLYR